MTEELIIWVVLTGAPTRLHDSKTSEAASWELKE